MVVVVCCVFFFKQKTAYEMRISDWSSDVCSSDLRERPTREGARQAIENRQGTESGAPMDLDHDEDGVVIENGHREQKQEGKLEKDLPQTDKSGDSLKGDTPEEDMPATDRKSTRLNSSN